MLLVLALRFAWASLRNKTAEAKLADQERVRSGLRQVHHQ